MLHHRQAGLPAPKDTRGIAAGGLNGLHVGRVTFVHWGQRTVDLMLDDASVLSNVPVLGPDFGPDRGTDDLPRKRSIVLVGFMYGHKTHPVVLGSLHRPGHSVPTPELPEDDRGGISRRVWASGTHMAVLGDGQVEVRTPDGTVLVMGAEPAAADSFSETKREAWNGNPYQAPEQEARDEPPAFAVTIRRPDGTHVTLKDGKLTIEAPATVEVVQTDGGRVLLEDAKALIEAPDEVRITQEGGGTVLLADGKASVNAPGRILVEQAGQGSITLDGGTMTLKAPGKVDVQAPSIHLRAGPSGIAISPAGVALVGPMFQWYSTPATVATFPPAGLVTLVPLPGLSPLPLL